MVYTAVVLDSESVAKLKAPFAVPEGWAPRFHHMTINMGPASIGPAAEMVGRDVELTVVSLARNALVMAVGVQCSTPSLNVHKHITVAVNELCGGTASMSNDLTEWTPVAPLVVRGVVAEVPPN
ncbi:MAG: hypothetical protein ACKODX_21100 [Gemmata sp.]